MAPSRHPPTFHRSFSRSARSAAFAATAFALEPLAWATQQGVTPPAAAPAPTSVPTVEPAPDADGGTTIPAVLIEARALGDGRFLRAPPLDWGAGRDVLSPEQIENAGAMNVHEVLRRSPNVVVGEETGSDSLPNIGLRGVTGNDGFFRAVNVSLLTDGIPLVCAPYGQPGASLFPFTLVRVYAIDIQKGGSSVRYGPNNVSRSMGFGGVQRVGVRQRRVRRKPASGYPAMDLLVRDALRARAHGPRFAHRRVLRRFVSLGP